MEPIKRADGVIINTMKLRAADISHKKVLCPACHDFIFQMWPEGWGGSLGIQMHRPCGCHNRGP